MNVDQIKLNDKERAALDKFLRRRDVSKILKGEGSKVTLTFQNGGGIGVAITAEAKNATSQKAQSDITDYGSW